MTKQSEKQPTNKPIPIVSTTFGNGGIVELVYRKEEQSTLLAVCNDGVVTYAQRLIIPMSDPLVPIRATHSLIKHQVVLLPSEAVEYDTQEALVADIKTYIRRYVALSSVFIDISAYYVLLTWVYDAFNEVPYLRWKGDFGSGKTRALTVIGSICYKPIFASGSSTVSPIFHSLDLFRGTLVFDEADFRFSDERTELTKIFNNGMSKGFPVLRSSVNDNREFDPKAFNVFGPKLVGMREVFQDYALESRFLTEEMQGNMPEDIPINLPSSQREEALLLRNKLLMYRFRMRYQVAVDPTRYDSTLSPRANQILLPLLSLIPDKSVCDAIKNLVASQEAELVRDRSTQVEALVLDAIIKIMEKEPDVSHVPLSAIRHKALALHGQEFDRPLTARYLGGLIRNKLRLKSFKSGVYMVEMPDEAILNALCNKYCMLK